MDVNALFASAEVAYAAGRYPEARRQLLQVERMSGDHPAVLHLLALVEKRGGDPDAAASAFARALKLSPRDPQINNNYAILLDEIGRTDEALVHYERALAADANFGSARYNRGLLLQRLGRTEEAVADFDAVIERDPQSFRVHSARGSALRELARFSESAAAYDRALALAPGHLKALEGRARVSLEAGEPDASAHMRRALAVKPDNPDLIIGLAEALEAEGDSQTLPYLAEAIAARPDWVEGQQRLAEMRFETQDPGHFARGYHEALRRAPRNRDLHISHWRALALAGCYDEALQAIRASGLPEDRDVRLMRAIFTGEAGDAAKSRDLLASLGDEVDVRMARARAALRSLRGAEAARLFESVIAEQPGNIAAWAHLGLAWRLTGDPRHEWLCEQPNLFQPIDLEIEPAALEQLTDVLRGLHKTRAHPIGQSLRGGTQTRGRLFWRSEPQIVALFNAIQVAIEQYRNALPPRDDAHPLLRHRDVRLHIAGSWSVRLFQSGFHVSHIHPQGVVSSACYIALPDSMGGSGGTDGWLELGAPPAELGLGLPALAVIKPLPGRLALFPSYLYHGTRPFNTGERLTVAFDVVPG